MTRQKSIRALYFLAPPALCLILFWRVLATWFVDDDFAWLDLHLQMNAPHDLWQVLFSPKAQGTVRVLSERLFFLVFSSLFGFHALPYRIWVLGTWFADLALASAIGARLTGSRAAGLLAALLWTANANLLTPLAWASAYNEVLCCFFILAAFYARLRWFESGRRKWRIAEWTAYLAGFGALEIMVMYPALAALHALCFARNRIRSTLPLFVPAVAFAIVHFLFIPRVPGPYYALAVDRRVPKTFLQYLTRALAPSQLVQFGARLPMRGLIAAAAIGIALALFAVSRLRRRELAPIFLLGWFVLLIAPMLPLPNHLEEYYLPPAVVGLAWLAGWALVTAWRASWGGRAAAGILAVLYLAGSIKEIDFGTRWYLARADRMRALVLDLQKEARSYPGSAFLLQGVDARLYQSGFNDNPFRLLGLSKVYLADRVEGSIKARFLISPEQALNLIEHGRARVLSVSDGLDITSQYEGRLHSRGVAPRYESVDLGDPVYSSLLGPTWYAPEDGFRWMPKTATVKLSGPGSPQAKLYVTGFAPAVVLASGPVTLRFRAGEREIGSATLRAPGMFSLEFGLPSELTGRAMIEISIEASKVFQLPGDQRALGMVFRTFAIH